MGRSSTPLSAELPPLILGTATFNHQYNEDPFSLPTTNIVHHAMTLGIRAFDTSPYYGPSEEILGRALSTDYVRKDFPRHTYRLLTKVGRIAGSSFDYSPAFVRYSVRRSLKRLRTDYLDVVYCHDVEFVSPGEVVEAVRELRRIRDTEGTLQYVGISGYPVDVLCSLSELVLKETGEPLDVVMSYANYTLQNTTLLTKGLHRLRAAGVDVVPNASLLGMGLLRNQGVPVGAHGDWHPAPNGLRSAISKAGQWVNAKNEKLEAVAIRYGLESWMKEASSVGASGIPLNSVDPSTAYLGTGERRGVSVLGVSSLQELEESVRIYRDVLDKAEEDRNGPAQITELATGVRLIIGPEWVDYAWPSPGADFVNMLPEGNEFLKEDPFQPSYTAASEKVEGLAVNVSEVKEALTPPPA
ncbi:putative L-galactose dehydrogenase (L-GalDH) [Talaromyces proteolyticus]|uniref:L-galactose dehydrogenase (L-GalDH) n=1 Tax=Talaromyces proteolyticus TaxID=1131652 RepID=A0AAD4KH86_9EURO|nr:putative L-galactose dehydrogenase (L-GalDH) [Talaromyces proteolyticus]KAH8691144.1 putative L-galactose dehydrogenase (L-GalDH) [Talaromyces proteolyticus]